MTSNIPGQKLILLIVLSLSSLFGHSQTEKVTIEGKSYYVYPHQQAIMGMQDYYLNFADTKEIIKRDERNEKIVSISLEPLTELEKKKALKFPKSYKKYIKDFEQILELYPYFMVTTDVGITVDPTPSLLGLPDGDYVMYYRDIPYISKRVLRYKNDIVAAFFSIKNNAIQGKSTWFSPEGKIVKTGDYGNSEKTGTWKVFEYVQKLDAENTYNPKESIENRLAKILYDTTKTTFTFLDGLKNGPFTVYENQELMTSGNYLADKPSGAWEIYQFKTSVKVDKKGNLSVIKEKDKVLIDRYTLRSDQKRGKSPIIRHTVIPYEFMDYESPDSLVLKNSSSVSSLGEEYDMGYEMDFPDFFAFLTVLEPETDNLELPEESLTSYEGEEMYEGDYYDPEFDFDADAEYSENEYYELVNKKRYRINDLIDSMGYLFSYDGVVESYYQNGQLKYRFEVKDGSLVKEEPVYWDNGTIANEVIFIHDSNLYVQRFYDYNGVKYHETRHDSKGNLLSNSAVNNREFVIIDNKKYDRNYNNPTLIYSEDKHLKKGSMPQKILVVQELFKVDSSLAKQVYFYPEIRTLNTFLFNIMGDTVSTQEVVFSEDYLNMNASKTWKYKNMMLKTIQNGTLNEYWKLAITDTVPLERLAFFWEYKYEVETDDQLFVNGKPFTGTFKLTDKTGSFSVKASDQSIQLSLPNLKTDYKIYQSAIKTYLKSKKRNDLLLGYISELGGAGQISHTVTGMFTNLYGVFSSLYEEAFYNFDGRKLYPEDEIAMHKGDQRLKEQSIFTVAEGKYLNGKAEGIWTYKDQFGKVRSTIGYKNGETHGDNFDYNVAFPKPKPRKIDEDYYGYENYEDPLSKYEEYPAKKIYFLESKSTFKNGDLSGAYITMNWKGDTLTYANFVDGAKEGLEFKRNKLFFSQAYYQRGYIDGNVKTYFTSPEKDSVLIFNLSFKNGALQGESVAYHSNGKLAKKGFFLSGQPIDDYEAYDTLGFKYQYVKFQYSQPIEEKIWEENELSVRYEFDWRDSIGFNFADITTSTSIDQLIYQVGYSDNELNQPYYGRPSLVNKTGIDYSITKYYPNDTIARIGTISKGVKTGCWKYFNYYGKKLMEVEYFDSIITVNDSIKFKSKGILYYLDAHDNTLSKSWIIEKFEKYDCSHTDHNEERMLYCFWEKDTTQHRKNGYVKNYYDNGSIQNEGWVKDGLPTGIWKLYDVAGNLNQVGEYVMGKRNGRWLKGDLGSVKNMSEICLNPNLENLDAILNYQEKLLDVSVITYQIGKELKRKYYGINMNNGEAPEGYYGEEEMYMEYGE